VALEIGIVGLPGSGKTTVFNALTRAGAEGAFGKENVGMATIADARLAQVAAVVSSRKVTPATVRVVDVPGTGAAMLGNVRRVDAVLAVLNGWADGADPAAELETLRLELLVADRDHVERQLERVLAHLERGAGLAEWDGALPPELEPLTTKPLIVLENGPGGIDAKLEAELAELPEDEAAAFREGPSALADVVRRLFSALDLVVFFTAGDNETRAWTLRRGQTALDAAGTIHSDLARGFIRCEVIRWSDLVECGSHAEAARRGLQRLEGKAYEVQDCDVLNVRFAV
jgi:ribosome-binding ATPase